MGNGLEKIPEFSDLCFPECIAAGFPFHSGGLGVEGMFARRCVYVRNRPQPFATVRNRPREGRMAVPMVSSAKGVTFGGFQRRVASLRMAGVALRDIQTLSEDALHFLWQAQHFGDHHGHFAWQAPRFRCKKKVVARVCESHCRALSGLREVVTRCKFRGRGILWDMLKI